MLAPQWAQDLVLAAILYLQSVSDLRPELPRILWRNAPKNCKVKRKWSSGICRPSHITIVVGTDRKDCKLIILHELAHWVLPRDQIHSPHFWDLAWQLYREFRLPIRYCKWREGEYRKGALVAYHKALKEKA